jgi:N-acetylmuramoyl-L-alanine amidase
MDFLSHPERERRLTMPHEQAAIADALAAAIRAYVTQ